MCVHACRDQNFKFSEYFPSNRKQVHGRISAVFDVHNSLHTKVRVYNSVQYEPIPVYHNFGYAVCSVYHVLIPDHRTKTICIPGNVRLPYLNCSYAKFPMTCYCKSNNLSDLLNQIRPNLSQQIHYFHSNFKFIG